MRINVIITHNCNLQCKHCYMSDVLSEFDESRFLENVELFKSISEELEIDSINYTGGECTTNPYLLYLLKWNKEKSIAASIFTNGVALDQSIISACNEFWISLDGTKDIHNMVRSSDIAFDKTWMSLTNIMNSNKRINIQTTVSELNISTLEALIPLYDLLSNNLGTIILECVVNAGNANRNNLILHKNQYTLIHEFKLKLLEHFSYSIPIRDNIYSKKQITQFVLNPYSTFPVWVDLIDGVGYVLNNKYSFPINSLSEYTVEAKTLEIKKNIKEKISSLSDSELVIIDEI